MKQIVQNLKTGKTELVEVPVPSIEENSILIESSISLVSLGTEKMLVNFGKANFINKARQQPEKVKQVLNKIKSDGLTPTIESVFRKLEEPMPLGYCNTGTIIGLGKNVNGFKIGDRVISNGPHSEFVSAPVNLVAKIPDNVSFEEASFTVVGSIGLQGIRLINPSYGETIVVIGLGLIGLLTVQLLKANGCNVIGIDFDERKIKIAKTYGITALNAGDDIVSIIKGKTNNVGADGVIITASTSSNEVISNAANITRKKGRIVLVGVIGLNIQRSDFYEKEISFTVSCSYGPGRYDSFYESNGLDYPIGYVRWTENRNFQAFLNALNHGHINVKNLITKSVPLDSYQEIYNNLNSSEEIACLINYSSGKNAAKSITLRSINGSEKLNGGIGIIGAGSFTSSTILPSLQKNKIPINHIVSSKGLSGTILAKKYRISKTSTDSDELLKDENINAVIISTRHDKHSDQVIQCLNADKHVFVEKPLGLNLLELESIRQAFNSSNKSILVGFNRRFSKYSTLAKQALGENPGEISVIINVNSGFIEQNHWVQDIKVGGGRIIGEACHFIDLISFFTSDSIQRVMMASLGVNAETKTDNATLILKYHNGSIGIINYYSNGHKSYPKERIEIYQGGKNIVIDNFRKISFYGFKSIKDMRGKQDKGHSQQFNEWYKSISRTGKAPVSFDSILNTSKAAIYCIESLKQNGWVNVD